MSFVWNSGQTELVEPAAGLPRLARLCDAVTSSFRDGSQVHLCSELLALRRDKAGYASSFVDNSVRISTLLLCCNHASTLPWLPLELWLHIVEIYAGAPKRVLAAGSFGNPVLCPPHKQGREQGLGKRQVTILSAFWTLYTAASPLSRCPAFFAGSKNIVHVDLSRTCVRLVPARSFAQCSSLSHIDLPKSVLVIEAAAFKDCIALSGSVTLPHAAQIGDQAFYRTKLSRLAAPALLQVPADMCYGCDQLRVCDVQNALSGSAGMFALCTALESVQFSRKCVLTNDCHAAFTQCVELHTLTCAQIVGVGEHMFEDCGKLALPGVKFAGTAPIRCFYNSSGGPDDLTGVFTAVAGESFRASTVHSVNCTVFGTIKWAAFAYTRLLTAVNLDIVGTDTRTGHVLVHEMAFAHSAVKAVVLRLSTVASDERHVVIGAGAFRDCISLQSVHVMTPCGLILKRRVFSGCVKLRAACIETRGIEINGPDTAVLQAGAFANCYCLEKLVFSAGVRVSYGSFVGCYSLAFIQCRRIQCLPHYTSGDDNSRHPFNKTYASLSAFLCDRQKQFCPWPAAGPMWLGVNGITTVHFGHFATVPTAEIAHKLLHAWHLENIAVAYTCGVDRRAVHNVRIVDRHNPVPSAYSGARSGLPPRQLYYVDEAKRDELVSPRTQGRVDMAWLMLYSEAFPYGDRHSEPAGTLALIVAYRALHACSSPDCISKLRDWFNADWGLPGSAGNTASRRKLAMHKVNMVCRGAAQGVCAAALVPEWSLGFWAPSTDVVM